MKKTILTILITVLVMSVLFSMAIVCQESWYEGKLIAIEEDNEALREKLVEANENQNEADRNYAELESDYENLQEQVYFALTDEAYQINMERDGKWHHFSSNGEGLFPKERHIVYG